METLADECEDIRINCINPGATRTAMRKAAYGIASAQRAAGLKRRLYEISKRVSNEHIRTALDTALAEPLKLGRREQLLAAADRIGAAAYEFAETADGASLSAIDPLLPKPEQYKQ